MRRNSVWMGAGLASVFGAVLGQLDAARAVQEVASGPGLAPIVGTVLGAVVGAVIGGALGAFLPIPGRSGVAAIPAFLLALVVGRGWMLSDPAAEGIRHATVVPPPVDLPRVLVVGVHGLGSRQLGDGTPNLDALVSQGVFLPDVWAPSSDPSVTRRAWLTGQWPGHPIDAVPGLGGLLGWFGHQSAFVLSGDTAEVRALSREASVRVPVSAAPGRVDAATARLTLLAPMAWGPREGAVPLERSLEGARRALAALGSGPWALVVELDVEEDLDAVDEAVGELVDAARAKAGERPLLIAVGGLEGRDDRDPLGRGALRVPWVLQLPDGALSGRTFRGDLSLASMPGSIAAQITDVDPSLQHAPVLSSLALRAGVQPRPQAVGKGPGDPLWCVGRPDADVDRGALAHGDQGDAYRLGGYAWVRNDAGTALYDEVFDPFHDRDLLQTATGTCGDRAAADRAADLAARHAAHLADTPTGPVTLPDHPALLDLSDFPDPRG